MEAVPKLQMVSFPLKESPKNAELGTRLRHLIQIKFGEDPESFAEEIRQLESLR